MQYRCCGNSGILLPAVALGLWQNFGGDSSHDSKRKICQTAFDHGINHFDLANNYGPPAGSAESAFGEILRTDLAGFRDELFVSTKAGFPMWDGPFGNWGSRKSLVASCDQSLARLGLDYVDVFYSHRPDPETPLEETMGALDYIVRSGRALYAGISSYSTEQAIAAISILSSLGTPCLVHQPRYNIINRWAEKDNLKIRLKELGVGVIAFSALAQGLLTDKYLAGVPIDSRASQQRSTIPKSHLSQNVINNIQSLNVIAQSRGQSLAQMALAWVLRDGEITTALIGASNAQQIIDCVGALDNLDFTKEELLEIDKYMMGGDIYKWA